MGAEKIVDKKFKRFEERFRKEKELIEQSIGRPHISLDVELPKGCEDMEKEFKSLSEDKEFMDELRDLVKKHLDRKREEKEKS